TASPAPKPSHPSSRATRPSTSSSAATTSSSRRSRPATASTHRRSRPTRASITSGSRSAASTRWSPSSRPRVSSSPATRPRCGRACASPSCARPRACRSSCSIATLPEPDEAANASGGGTMDDKGFAVTHTDEEWRRLLTPEQYQVLRGHGTEAPGSCALNYEKRPGTFVCAGCGQPLFVSKKKFESGTGWPSFNDPVQGAVETSTDRSYGMVRTEVHC